MAANLWQTVEASDLDNTVLETKLSTPELSAGYPEKRTQKVVSDLKNLDLDLEGRCGSFRKLKHAHLPTLLLATHGFMAIDEDRLLCVGCDTMLLGSEIRSTKALLRLHKSGSRLIDGDYVCHFLNKQSVLTELRERMRGLNSRFDDMERRHSLERDRNRAQFADVMAKMGRLEKLMSESKDNVTNELREGLNDLARGMEALEEKLFFCVKVEPLGVPPVEAPSTEGDTTAREADDRDCWDSEASNE